MPFSRIVSVSSSTRSVIRLPEIAATLTPRAPSSRSQCTMRCAAPSGLIQPWLLMILVPRLRHAGQHRLHAIVEIGVVAGKGRIAARAHLRGRDGGLGHGLEAQIVEIALLGVERGGLDAVAPPGRAGADADRVFHWNIALIASVRVSHTRADFLTTGAPLSEDGWRTVVRGRCAMASRERPSPPRTPRMPRKKESARGSWIQLLRFPWRPWR